MTEAQPSLAAFGYNLKASIPASYGEALSIFSSGALAGLSLEAAMHGARVVHSRHKQLKQGHPIGSLGLKWWLAALGSTKSPKGPYQGAVGTLAAGSIWSGIFGSVYVPVRAAVDATAPPDQPGWGPALAAASGSLFSSSVRVPKQVVKARMEQQEFFCSLQAFERILVREGPAALYRGWARSITKNMPFDAVLFLLYDTGKTRLLTSRAATSCDEQRRQQRAAAEALAPVTAVSGAEHLAGMTCTHTTGTGQGVKDAAPGLASSMAILIPGQPGKMAAYDPKGSTPESPATRKAGAGAATSVSCDPVSSAAVTSTALLLPPPGEVTINAAPPQPYSFVDAALIGGAAGTATGLITAPLELARVALQGSQEGTGPQPSGASINHINPQPQQYNSIRISHGGGPSSSNVSPSAMGGDGGSDVNWRHVGTSGGSKGGSSTTHHAYRKQIQTLEPATATRSCSPLGSDPRGSLHRSLPAVHVLCISGNNSAVSLVSVCGEQQHRSPAPRSGNDRSMVGIRSVGIRGSCVAAPPRMSLGSHAVVTPSSAGLLVMCHLHSSDVTAGAISGPMSSNSCTTAMHKKTSIGVVCDMDRVSTGTTRSSSGSLSEPCSGPSCGSGAGRWLSRWSLMWQRSPSMSFPSSWGGALTNNIMSRVLWSGLEGAVFFPSLEVAIRLCDWIFLPEDAMLTGLGHGAEAFTGKSREQREEGDWDHVPQGAGPRHPAHPLHW